MNALIQVFMSRRMFFILLLGFASGLPLALTGGTLQAWLKDAGVDLSTIGRFALIGLPYTLKFLWAPFLDEYLPPFLGRRRGWGLCAQVGLVGSIALLGFTDPAQNLLPFSLVAFAIAFFSASQDIVLDAFRTELLKEEEMGAGAGVYNMGYRLAMIVSGAFALGLADHVPWKVVYLCMAAVMAAGMVAVWFAPEPPIAVKTGKSFGQRVLQPFLEFFRMAGAVEILIFVMVYKLSTMMATSLTTAFLMEMSFTKTEIGTVTKIFGLIATIVGTLTGGALMTKMGLKRALWIFGVLQSLGALTFLLLAVVGRNMPLMIGVILAENFMIGLGVAAIQGFMMRVCNRQFTGTQFALLSSLPAIPRVILASQAGLLADKLGWPGFFLFSIFLAIPGLLLLTRFDHWLELPTDETKRKFSVWDAVTIALFVLGLIGIASQPLWVFMNLEAWAGFIEKIGAVCVVLALASGLVKSRFAFN